MEKVIKHNKKIIRLNINLFFFVLNLIQLGLVVWYGMNFKNRSGVQALLEFLNSFALGVTSSLAVLLNIKISKSSGIRVVSKEIKAKVVVQPTNEAPQEVKQTTPEPSKPIITPTVQPKVENVSNQPSSAPLGSFTPTTPATPAAPAAQETQETQEVPTTPAAPVTPEVQTPQVQPSVQQQPQVQPNVRPQVHMPTVEIPTIQMPKPQLDSLMQETEANNIVEAIVVEEPQVQPTQTQPQVQTQPQPQPQVQSQTTNPQSMDEQQINFLYQFLGQLTSLEDDIKKLKDLRDHNQDNAIVELRNKTSEKIDAQRQYLAPITRASRKSNYVVACCNIIEDFHKKVGDLLDTIDDKTIIMHVNRLRLRDHYFDKFDELYKELEDIRIEYPAPFEA